MPMKIKRYSSNDCNIEVQDYDLLSVKLETEECKHLQQEREGDLSDHLPDSKRKLSLACSMLNCLLQCRQILLFTPDSDSQLIPRLVECPFCLWECKNYPDRLLRLLDHAQQIHRASLDTMAEFILKKYPRIISVMMNEYSKLLHVI